MFKSGSIFLFFPNFLHTRNFLFFANPRGSIPQETFRDTLPSEWFMPGGLSGVAEGYHWEDSSPQSSINPYLV